MRAMLRMLAVLLPLTGLLGATVPAGAQPGACDITVYWDANFAGPAWRIMQDHPFVGDRWNDQISSLVVGAGIWEFFWDANYGGNRITYRPGQRIPFLGSIWNDQISSMRCVKPGM